MMSKASVRIRLALLTGLVSACTFPLRGEETPASHLWFAHRPDRAWLQPYDPTLLSRRLFTEYEHTDFEDGDSSAKWKWNLRWALPVTKDLAAGLQLELPWSWVEEDGQDDIGFGDLETRAGLAGRISESSRWAFAINGKFPTGASNLLSDGVFELRPIAALRWEAASWLQLGANAEYSFTPRDEGDARVSALELKLPVVVKLAERLSGTASYNPKWNDVNGSWRHRLELGLTCLLGSRKEYALSIVGEIPLTDEAFESKVTIGITRFFN